MADNNTIGLAMQLDVTDLKAGLKEVNKSIKDSKDAFANATAGMEKWSKSSDGLNAKLNQLNTQLDAQEKAVAGYKAEIERVSKLEGDHSTQLEDLHKKLSKAEASVKKTQSEITKYSKSLADVTKEEKKASSAFTKLTDEIDDQKKELSYLQNEYKGAVIQYGKNSKEAKALGKQIKNLNGELENNQKKADKAEKAEDDLGKTLDKLSGIGSKAVKGLAVVGGAVAGLATAFLATAETSREFRNGMAKLDASFENSGHSAEDAEKTYKEFYGVLGDEGKALEASAHLSKLAKNQEDLSNWTKIATGIYSQFGDSLPIEGLMEGANETARTGELTGALADALNWASAEGLNFGVSLKEQIAFTELSAKQVAKLTDKEREEYEAKKKQYEEIEKYNESIGEAISAEDKFKIALQNCSNEQERAELIQSTLNGIYGETGEKFKENNKDLIANNEAQLEMNKAMAELGKQAEPIMLQIKQIGVELAQAILPVVQEWLPVIMDNLPTITALILGVVTAIGTFSAAMKIATAVQWAMNAAQSANPIGLIILAISALVGAIVALTVIIVKNWDKIKETTMKVFGAIKDFIVGVWEAIKKAFSAVGTFFSDIFTKAWNGIKKAWSGVNKFFLGIIDSIVGFFKELPDNMKNIGKNIVEGLWNGIKDMTKWVKDKIKGFTKDVLNGIKGFFGIHSPSKKTAEIGGYLADGMVVGLEDKKSDVEHAGEDLGKAFTEGMQHEIEKDLPKITDTLDKKVKSGSLGSVKINSVSDYLAQGGVDASKVTEKVATETTQTVKKAVNENYQTWSQWLQDILGVDKQASLSGAKSAEAYFKSLEEGLHSNKNFAEMLGENFNMADALKSQNDEIKKALEAMLTIDPKDIDSVFTQTDDIVNELVKKYNENLGKIKEINIKPTIDPTPFEKYMAIVKKDMENFKKTIGDVMNYIANQFETIAKNVMTTINAWNDLESQRADQRLSRIEEQLDAVSESKEKELEAVQKTSDKEMSEIDMLYTKELIDAETYRARKLEIENELYEAQKSIEEQKNADELSLKKERDEISKKQFEAQKKSSIAQAMIDGASAVVKAFAQGGWIMGSIFAGLTATATGIQIKKIKEQQYVPAFAKGGIIDRPTIGLVGEAGKEAIMPLENNTGWIEELAEKLNGFMNKDFNLGGRQVAYAEAGNQSVYNNFNQTINAPKMPNRRELYRDTKNLLALKRR